MSIVETELELTYPVSRAFEIAGESVDFSLSELSSVLSQIPDIHRSIVWGETYEPPRWVSPKVILLARKTYEAWSKDAAIPAAFTPSFFWMNDRDPITMQFARARLAYEHGCEGLRPWIEFLNHAARRDLGLYFKGYLIYPGYNFKSTLVQFYSPLSDLPESHTLDEIMNDQLVKFLNASSYMPVMARPLAGTPVKRVMFREDSNLRQ